MGLAEYKKKRNFKQTSEPEGKEKSSQDALKFVVQKHNASRLHYDFRLELDGVLKSWAVPKGPSLNPEDKRLAMMVEDHPYDYRSFEGIIPKGNYGAGEVIVWDEGTYHSMYTNERPESDKELKKGLYAGDLKFTLHGEKLNGSYALVKTKGRGENSWLLIKKKDEFATTEDVTMQEESVVSGRTLADLKNSPDDADVWISNRKYSGAKPKAIQAQTGSNGSESGNIEKALSLIKDYGAAKKTMPSAVTPMLATLVKEPFDDPDWIFEIKWDGYRGIAEIYSGTVSLHSRKNLDFNQKFAPVTNALKSIKNKVILDGEVVVLNEEGKSDFQLLQNFQRTGQGNIIYYVFDILYLDGYDLKGLPLIQRKEILQAFLPKTEIIKYSDHIVEMGKDFFKLAQQNHLEGIIAKRASSKYQDNKRSKDWLKMKTQMRQEAIIAGFTKPRGSRKDFGALVLGLYEGDELVYIGHSGGGFNEEMLSVVKNKLTPLITKTSPFKKKIKTNMPVTWVEPKLVCEVIFSEWTEDDNMRHPIFVAIREDKNPKEVKKEIPVAAKEAIKEAEEETPEPRKMKKVTTKKVKQSGTAIIHNSGKKGSDREITANKIKLKITNPGKIYFPDDGITKGELIDYYDSISKYMLPYLKDRPESLNRHPNGIYEQSFFQKDMRDTAPDWAETKMIYSESNDKDINYFICSDKASLLYLVNLGCIEINPWFSRTQNLDYPDYCVIDLDPEEIGFDKVIETAQVVKEVLDEAGAKSYCKTSGATGLHIYMPMKAKYNYDVSREFAHLIAKIVNGRIPEITSLERSPSKRKKKVYLDYLQNRAGQTLAAPYSVRPKPGATVATPLEWKEVKQGLDPRDFTIKTIHKRLKAKGDLFKPVLGAGINIEKCMKTLESKGY